MVGWGEGSGEVSPASRDYLRDLSLKDEGEIRVELIEDLVIGQPLENQLIYLNLHKEVLVNTKSLRKGDREGDG